MAHYDHLFVTPMVAASAIPYGVAVTANPSSAEQVYAAGSTGQDIIGVSAGSVPSYGGEFPLVRLGVVKALCAASVGAGARVGVASTNGALGPIGASGVLASAGPSAGLLLPRYSVGQSLKAAAAGEYFPVYLDPRQII